MTEDREHGIGKASNGMTRRQTAIAIAASALAPRPAFAATPAGTIDAALRAAVDAKSIPGVVAMAADKNGVLYHGAFGVSDIAAGRAMREDDLFRIASMTKAVTSVAAMQLVEQGKFTLDDPVQKYLPQFTSVPKFASFDAATGAYSLKPATNAVTVRHLFTHTSGIGYNFTSPILRDFKPREGETYPVGPLLFEPGERWHYGESLDQGLGKLIEEVSSQNLEDYFRAHIFTPLGMADTGFVVSDRNRLVAFYAGADPVDPMKPGLTRADAFAYSLRPPWDDANPFAGLPVRMLGLQLDRDVAPVRLRNRRQTEFQTCAARRAFHLRRVMQDLFQM
jgi:CubicO group peptidase (beta-lactamase class C family)